MGKAPSSQTGDIPYYHPLVTDGWGSVLTVSKLDLFCWGENFPWDSRCHDEEPSEIQMWRLQIQIIVTSSRIKIWFLESPGSEWTTAFCGSSLTAQERSLSTAPAASFPCTRPCCWNGLSCSLWAGIEMAFNSHGFPTHPHRWEQNLWLLLCAHFSCQAFYLHQHIIAQPLITSSLFLINITSVKEILQPSPVARKERFVQLGQHLLCPAFYVPSPSEGHKLEGSMSGKSPRTLSQQQILMCSQRGLELAGMAQGFQERWAFYWQPFQSGLNCKCYHWSCLLIRLVALPASAQVHLPKILHILVFHADKGAVVKETLVAMNVFMSCLCRNHLSNSFQTHSSRGPSDSCDPPLEAKKCSRNMRNEKKLSTSMICTHPPLTQPLKRLKWN